jgi:hypothetical protein
MGSYVQVSSNVNELICRCIAYPPFPKSVLTTAEINFCDTPSISRKNWDTVKHCNKSVWHLVLFCDFIGPVFIQRESTSTSEVLLLALRTLAT